MLNDTIITCVWGSTKSKLGNYSHTVMNSELEVNNFIVDMNKRRAKRGYILIGDE